MNRDRFTQLEAEKKELLLKFTEFLENMGYLEHTEWRGNISSLIETFFEGGYYE